MKNCKEIKHGSNDYKKAMILRDAILRKPLGRVYSAEDSAKEADSFHLICVENGEVMATLIFKPLSGGTLQMRQVAVKKSLQGKGYGCILVKFSENFAKERGYKEIILHSRATAVGFYEKLGYQKYGDGFIEIGLPHFMMKKVLD